MYSAQTPIVFEKKKRYVWARESDTMVPDNPLTPCVMAPLFDFLSNQGRRGQLRAERSLTSTISWMSVEKYDKNILGMWLLLKPNWFDDDAFSSHVWTPFAFFLLASLLVLAHFDCHRSAAVGPPSLSIVPGLMVDPEIKLACVFYRPLSCLLDL